MLKIITPTECNEAELNQFKENVIKGGQVTPFRLEERIKKARLLAFNFKEDALVGIAALKIPNIGYKKDVFEKAEVLKYQDKYPLELGWVFTKSEFRGNGIASELVSRLLTKVFSENLFATTRTKNIGMQKILQKNDFQKVGESYLAENENYSLQLFVRAV